MSTSFFELHTGQWQTLSHANRPDTSPSRRCRAVWTVPRDQPLVDHASPRQVPPHGCFRMMEDAIGFAAMLANEQGAGVAWWQAHACGDYAIVHLPRGVPVRLLYRNLFVDSDDTLAFRTDPDGPNDVAVGGRGFGGGDARRVKAGAIDIGR